MAVYYANELEHHGILGMKWGVRRFQNPDGTLTPEGKERYYGNKETGKFTEKVKKADTFSGTDSFGRTVMGVRDYDDNGHIARLRRTPQMKSIASEARESWKSVGKLEKSLLDTERKVFNEKTMKSLSENAAENIWKSHRKMLEKEGWTLETYKTFIHYEDYKQYFLRQNVSNTNGFNWWVHNSGDPKAKQYLSDSDKYKAAYKEYQKKCDSLLRDFFGDYVRKTDTSTVEKGQAIVDSYMRLWDTYEQEWKNGQTVPVSKISRLLI